MAIPTEDIEFFKSSELGEGLPFAIVSHDVLMETEDLFRPSLRDFHVIFWFKKGRGTYYVDFRAYEFRPNTVVLISKDQLHYIEKPAGDWEVQSITFKSEFIYRNDSDLKHLFHFTIACHIEGIQIINLQRQDIDFLNVISDYMRMTYSGWSGKVRENAFYHWLCLFLIHCGALMKLPDDIPDMNIDENSKILLHFNELLEKYFRTEFKVEFYAERLGISAKSLARITKDRYKLSPKSVIDERRILEIKRQLHGTSKAGKTIAYELGFDEPTNMIKYFKKHTRLTPHQFKNAEPA